MSTKIKALDTISGAEAEVYFTIEGQRYNMMHLTALEAKWTPNIATLDILGQTSKGHKPIGAEGTFTGTAYYVMSALRIYMLHFKQDGTMSPMEIQITNEDKASSNGKQTVVLKQCYLSEAVIAKFDASTDSLTEDINGTFDDWEIVTPFNLLDGMLA